MSLDLSFGESMFGVKLKYDLLEGVCERTPDVTPASCSYKYKPALLYLLVPDVGGDELTSTVGSSEFVSLLPG